MPEIPDKGFRFEKTFEVSFDQARRYAEASGDFNPIHIDENFARSVGLSGPILHGLCTLSMISHGVAGFTGKPQRLRRIKVRFKNPVYPGDTLKIAGEVMEADTQTSSMRLAVTCRNQKEQDLISGGQVEWGPPQVDTNSQMPTNAVRTQDEFTMDRPAIESWLAATGWSGAAVETVPPLFCSVYAMRPFLKAFLGDVMNNKPSGELLRILHGGQEFEFFKPLQFGEVVTTYGAIERQAKKGGQEFIYYLTESYTADKNLAVRGRWLAIGGNFGLSP